MTRFRGGLLFSPRAALSFLCGMALGLLLTVGLAACGKRPANIDPPPDADKTGIGYPAPYPPPKPLD